MSRVVFISHMHADEPIASVLNEHLQRWQLRREEIFQSTRAEGGARLGGQLSKELLGALSEARLVLLVYTTADANWSYCMWECGVAVQPMEPDATRVIVFRVTDDIPHVLRDLVSVRVSEESDVKRFVQQFFREKGWVRENDAFNAELTDKVLDGYASDLYSDLIKVAPKSRVEEKRRWDVLTLRFDAASTQEIIGIHKDQKGISESTISLIQTHGKVVYDFGQALMHFGYDPKVRELTLSHLIRRWSEEIDEAHGHTTPRDWIRELCDELLRAIRSRPAKPSWAVMASRLYPGWWFYPVVNHQRVQGDGSMEFDVYMYRLPGNLPATVDLISE